ncbi:MAG: ParB/RepB/Spo0J family partition protein [Acidobacteriota bacterium]|nr:ParB/RepB/Spo0J family partition protein [Acidobacteriota bacterium]
MTKLDPRKALGKGLHSLLPSRGNAAGNPIPAPEAIAGGEPQSLPIDFVAPNPNQPRREFDPAALMELTQSIERDGIIQPIIVRKMGPSQYQIIAGERRWRAAKNAQLTEVPVVVRTADDQQVLELAIVENIQREDLNPIELALAFHRMGTELGLSHDQIGQKTGKERTTITNAVRLLQLPEELQTLVAGKQLSAGHARALLKFQDRDLQVEIARRCIAEGWSVRQIEHFTKPKAPGKPATKENEPQDPNVKFAVGELERLLGTRVRIVDVGKGSGLIEIEYYSADDLSRIYETITGGTE